VDYVVTCIKSSSSRSYHCADMLEAGSPDMLELGDIVEIREGVAISRGGKSEAGEIIAHADRLAGLLAAGSPYKSGIKEADDVIPRMWPTLLSASRLLVRKLLLGAPVIVHFHNDADGASGAYVLYKSIEDLRSGGALRGECDAIWLMNRGVTYDVTDANHDRDIASGFSAIDKPLLVIIDFGTSVGSNLGIRHIVDQFDVIWLDHHPVEEGFAGAQLPLYINPWKFGGDSNITAGFLSAVFSKTISRMDTREIENASFIGDYSSYADKRSGGTDLATLLDMITSDVRIATGRPSKNITPKEIDAIISDKQKYKELLAYAKTRMSDTIGMAMKSIKRYKAGDSAIYLSEFDRLRGDDTKYPLPGRFSSKLLEQIIASGSGHAILILHFGSFISIRVDGAIADSVGLLGIIAELKDRYAEEIESGGGHKNAANIKLAQGYDKAEIIKELISMLKSRLK